MMMAKVSLSPSARLADCRMQVDFAFAFALTQAKKESPNLKKPKSNCLILNSLGHPHRLLKAMLLNLKL